MKNKNKLTPYLVLAFTVLFTIVPNSAYADPNQESSLPQDGVQSITRSGDTWTITFDGTPWESKVISNPQKILCGSNYGKSCRSTETFTWAKPCVYIQTDWQGSHNSSDVYVCREDSEVSPSPSPSETATPSPVYEYWDKTTIDCKGAGDEWVWTDHYRRVKGESKWTWISKDKTRATAKQCPEPTATPSPSAEPTPTETPTPTTSASPETSVEPTTSTSPTITPEKNTEPYTPPKNESEASPNPQDIYHSCKEDSLCWNRKHPSCDLIECNKPKQLKQVKAVPAKKAESYQQALAHTGLSVSGIAVGGILALAGTGLLCYSRKRKKN